MKLLVSTLLCCLTTAQAQFGFVRQRWVNNGGTIVQCGGLPLDEWGNSGDWANNYTVYNLSGGGIVWWDATLSYVKWWSLSSGTGAKAKHLTRYHTNRNSVYFVQETTGNLAANGTNTVNVSWSVLEGDILGFYHSAVSPVCYKNVAGVPYDYANADLVTSQDMVPSSGVINNCGAWGTGPALAIVGDSIMTGFTNWYPAFSYKENVWFYRPGLVTNGLVWKVKNKFGLLGSVANFSAPSKGIAWANTDAMAFATNSGAKALWLAIGINDISADMTWATYLTSLDGIRAKWPRSKPMFVASVLPTTNLMIGALSRCTNRWNWNTNLSVWCSKQGATFVNMVDSDFAEVWTGVTENYDKLKAEYKMDEVHLNDAGRELYARKMVAAVRSCIK